MKKKIQKKNKDLENINNESEINTNNNSENEESSKMVDLNQRKSINSWDKDKILNNDNPMTKIKKSRRRKEKS